MAFEKIPVTTVRDFDPPESSFETVLDNVCERLREKHILYSIRRLGELDEELTKIEKELDELLGPGHEQMDN